jgi:hypothetical protein
MDTNSKIEFDVNNIIQYIITNITNSDYNLSKEQIKWIQKFIALSPNSLEVILTDIENIIDDNKIDLHDIPIIIKLITDIYHFDALKIGISDPKIIISFIKYTINALIDSQYIGINSAEKRQINNIINISLDLLNINLTSNKVKYCFNVFGC